MIQHSTTTQHTYVGRTICFCMDVSNDSIDIAECSFTDFNPIGITLLDGLPQPMVDLEIKSPLLALSNCLWILLWKSEVRIVRSVVHVT